MLLQRRFNSIFWSHFNYYFGLSSTSPPKLDFFEIADFPWFLQSGFYFAISTTTLHVVPALVRARLSSLLPFSWRFLWLGFRCFKDCSLVARYFFWFGFLVRLINVSNTLVICLEVWYGNLSLVFFLVLHEVDTFGQVDFRTFLLSFAGCQFTLWAQELCYSFVSLVTNRFFKMTFVRPFFISSSPSYSCLPCVLFLLCYASGVLSVAACYCCVGMPALCSCLNYAYCPLRLMDSICYSA